MNSHTDSPATPLPDLSKFPEKVQGTLRRSLQLPADAPAPAHGEHWEYQILLLRIPVRDEDWAAFLTLFETTGAEGWRQCDSYAYPPDTGLRVYHFCRKVPT